MPQAELAEGAILGVWVAIHPISLKQCSRKRMQQLKKT